MTLTMLMGTFALSAVGTYWIRQVALRFGLLDHPNERSSHSVPMPRGGGLAVVVSVFCGFALLAGMGEISWHLAIALLIGGAAVSAIGLVDDRYGVSAPWRLLVHVLAAGIILAMIGVPTIDFGFLKIKEGALAAAVVMIGIVWSVNLFNFMDGIDGIAAIEFVFMTLSASILHSALGGSAGIALSLLVLASACGGFLCFNWPPARIFMGDVGSGFLGFMIGFAAVTTSIQGPLNVWAWAILCGTFLVDATLTLIVRIVRGEPWYCAHRSHIYQQLAVRWKGHRQVLLAYLAIDLIWLAPLAWVSVRWPSYAVLALVGAITPLIVIGILLGAGRADANMVINDF